jgi:hypothetical protein
MIINEHDCDRLSSLVNSSIRDYYSWAKPPGIAPSRSVGLPRTFTTCLTYPPTPHLQKVFQ